MKNNQQQKKTGNNTPFADQVFDQMVQISKAHAYDIVSPQVKELQEENEKLKAENKRLKDRIAEFELIC